MPLPDRPNEPAAKQPSLGACADGMAWANGQSRAALQLAVQQLSEAQAGGAPAALCHAHTELARALAALHAYSPAESHLASAARWAGRALMRSIVRPLVLALKNARGSRA